ncbi:MAG: protein kinase [Archangium sp.]|nr:protein kinase [Archangium sp.]
MICPGCQQAHADGGTCVPGDSAAPDPLLGKALGDYSLVRELGRGNTGVVYLAEHLATGLNVAIKLAHRELMGDLRVARLMSREAQFANQIALDSVVNVFDFNDEDPLGPYLVMEYLQGEPLLDIATQRVAGAEAIQLLVQVAEALAEAHELNIVHAALKPSNVFRTVTDKKERVARLLPFGVPIGPRIDGEEPGDRDVARLGSPEFRAPEQTLGAPADPRMDVYSLGAIAYLLATGRLPFVAPTPEALERAHAMVMPTAPHRVDVRVSRTWSAVILRAMEKSPEGRFQTARELADAFRMAASAPSQVGSATVVLGGDGDALKPPLSISLTPAPLAEPPPAPAASSVGGGLADGFVVTTTPAPSRPPVETPRPSSPSAVSAPAPAQGLVLRVMVTDESGTTLGDFACSSVTRAGLIVCTPGPLPPLLSRVKLSFADLGGLRCDAQVVHHVTAEQATQWKVSAGYGVQFSALSPEQRGLLESAHQGLRPPESPSGLARRPDDPGAEEILKRFSAERAVDGYAMLAISKGAPFDAIRDRVRHAKRALEGLVTRPLSLSQHKALEEARTRLDEVGKTLTEAMSRLEYDAARGNFEGVARCISAGVSVVELEAARLRFLKSNPTIAGKSHGNILAGQTLEARQQMPQALDAYADALRVDPLNLTAQQRYWAVRRQLDKT